MTVQASIGHFVVKAWITEGICPGVVPRSHDMGRWKTAENGQRQMMATVRLDWKGSLWTLQRERGVEPFPSRDADTERTWWTDAGVRHRTSLRSSMWSKIAFFSSSTDVISSVVRPKYVAFRWWSLRGEIEARGGGDVVTSLTTSNEEIAPQSPPARVAGGTHATKGHVFRTHYTSLPDISACEKNEGKHRQREAVSTFIFDRNHDAFAVIRGFVYQADVTIRRWIALREDKALEVERGQNIDIVAAGPAAGWRWSLALPMWRGASQESRNT